MEIPFNKPTIIGKEKEYVNEVITSRKLSGDGPFTKKCSQLMEKDFKAKKVLLTTSCTHALELASLLLDLKDDDEVIMPSYTFTSTATCISLRGVKPVFVDVREDTLNIDENLIEEKITDKTKAIYVVHYAGVSCEMNKINEIAKKHGLYVVEDAAQGVNAKYDEKYLGTLSDMGTYSFHETKNYVCGEGGAIVINNEKFIERAEIIREKGTNRSKFIRGEIDKYTWTDIGSSYLPSELIAAYLYAQLENKDKILDKRKEIYEYYNSNLKSLKDEGKIKLPSIPNNCESNYHMFYILLNNELERNNLLSYLKKSKINSTFHYIPLHLSDMGRKFGYKKGDLPITEKLSSELLRLPFYYELTSKEQDYIIEKINNFFNKE